MAVSPQTLRDEGVLDLGCVNGTSALYVMTQRRLFLFHARELPTRALDRYGVQLAVIWIELGAASRQVSIDLGVTESELRRALIAAGYRRLSPAELAQKTYARSQRKLGNRHGRLTRTEASA